MPSWHGLLEELKTMGSSFDVLRRKYLRHLHEQTKRNVIVYYSGWLQKPGLYGLQVNDADKNGFMTVVHGLDRTKGLDLILHTPGGESAATESIIDYLRSMFGDDIRAVIPQLAMSAGTMIACACREIIMGRQSSLGPIDPQVGGLPAHAIVEEFTRASKEIKEDMAKIPIWQPIIAKYNPALIGECEKAIDWSNEIVQQALRSGMFKDDSEVDAKISTIIKELSDHALTKSHSRHLSAAKCREIGLNVIMMEDNNDLQDSILSVHHACIHTLGSTAAYKIIENHNGVAFIQLAQTVVVQAPAGPQPPIRIEGPVGVPSEPKPSGSNNDSDA
jgi:ATP-dependent protease ClpP protease subunit